MKNFIFTPPIEEREIEELIGIAHCSDDSWQEEAKEQAKLELEKRNISMEYQINLLNKWNEEIEEYERQQEIVFKENELKEYTFLQQLIIFILTPFILLGKVNYGMSITDLKNQHFKKKVIQRRNILIIGAVTFVLVFYILTKK